MTDLERAAKEATIRRLRLWSGACYGLGLLVWMILSLTTGNMLLGLLAGLGPGAVLGTLFAARATRLSRELQRD